MRFFHGKFQPVGISGNQGGEEDRSYGIEERSNTILKSKCSW